LERLWQCCHCAAGASDSQFHFDQRAIGQNPARRSPRERPEIRPGETSNAPLNRTHRRRLQTLWRSTLDPIGVFPRPIQARCLAVACPVCAPTAFPCRSISCLYLPPILARSSPFDFITNSISDFAGHVPRKVAVRASFKGIAIAAHACIVASAGHGLCRPGIKHVICDRSTHT
jgi:hypothetical protein